VYGLSGGEKISTIHFSYFTKYRLVINSETDGREDSLRRCDAHQAVNSYFSVVRYSLRL